jgi:hypothetical protein
LPECDEAGRYYSLSKETRWSHVSRNSGLMGQLCALVEEHIVVKIGFLESSLRAGGSFFAERPDNVMAISLGEAILLLA